MDGGGIAETGRDAHIVERQPGGQLAAVVPDGEIPPLRSTRVMVHRSPFLTQSVAERRRRRSFLRVMITSPTLARFPSARPTSRPAKDAVAMMITGSAVELSDQLAGRSEHDRVESGRLDLETQAAKASSVILARSPT